MNLDLMIDPTFSTRLCLTLLHSLWQMTLLAAVAGGIARLWQRRSVERSYAVHVTALIAGLAALPVTYAVVDVAPPPDFVHSRLAVSHGPSPPPPLETSLAPTPVGTDGLARLSEADIVLPVNGPVVAANRIGRAVPTPAPDSAAVWPTIAPWIVALYALGVLLMLARLASGLWRARRLAAKARPLHDGPVAGLLRSLARQWSMRITPALALAEQIVVPQVAGLLRPTILLPASAVTGLSADELQMILAHELAHIRRHDLWVNLLQRLAETVLFFNPALWYLSRRVSSLREFCCDELTCREMSAATVGDPTPSEDLHPPLASNPCTADPRTRYATALLRVAQLSRPTPADPESAPTPDPSELATLAASGRSPSELRRRIAHLFGEPIHEPIRLSQGSVLGLAIAATLLFVGPTVWQAKTDDAAEKLGNDNRFELFVVGPDGRPVPYASVEVRPRPKPEEWTLDAGKMVRDGNYGPFTQTGPDGKLSFDLPDEPFEYVALNITTDGFAPYWAEWNLSGTSMQLPSRFTAKLDAGQSMGGVVVDEEGHPIVGASVRPSIKFKKRDGDLSELGVGTRLKTDVDGQWSYHSVPAAIDELRVSVYHPEFAPLSKSLSMKEFAIEEREAPTAQLVMQRGITVTGIVTDEDGDPISGAIIRTVFRNDRREVETGANGQYKLVGCPPVRTSLVATATGRAPDLKNVEIGDGMAPADFTLQQGRTIRVRVNDADGNPIPRSRVFFKSWRGDRHDYELGQIHAYTDENGVWEWNEAPSDEVVASIYATDHMEIKDQALVARPEEYVYTPPPALVISGRVIDAESKQPVREFRMVPGVRFSNDRLLWIRTDGFDSTNGTYRIKHVDYRDAHLVRIEAAGYRAAVSRDIKSDEGNITIDFELHRGKDVEATVRSPDGSLAVGAEVALGLENTQIHIRNGEFTRGNYCARATTDGSGHFRFPPQDAPFQLLILYATGFANVRAEPDNLPSEMTLKPWGRIDGLFRIGQAGASEISIKASRWQDVGNILRSLNISNEATTDESGRFVFERMLPGKYTIGREVAFKVTQSMRSSAMSHGQTIEVSAGDTTKVSLGGTGRPVIGRLVAPAGVDAAIDWNFSLVEIEPLARAPESPPIPIPDEIKGDQQKIRAFWVEWKKTEIGKGWTRIQAERQLRQSERPRYKTNVSPDGSFRMEDVPAGIYNLKVTLDSVPDDGLGGGSKTIGRLTRTIPVEDEQANGPLDLGELQLQSPLNENPGGPAQQGVDTSKDANAPATAQQAVGAVQNAQPQSTTPAEEPERTNLNVIIAKHVMLLEGREVMTWEQLEERIAALPDPLLAHPHFYVTRGAMEAGKEAETREHIWRIRSKYKMNRHSYGSLSLRADFRYDAIETEANLVPDEARRIDGTVIDPDGNPVTGAEVLLVTPVDDSIAYKSYHIALVEGRVRNSLEHVMTHSDDAGKFMLFPPEDGPYYVIAVHPDAGFALTADGQFIKERRVQLLDWAGLVSEFGEEPDEQQASLTTHVPEYDGRPEISINQHWSDLKQKEPTLLFGFTHVPPFLETTISRTFPDKEGVSFSLPGASVHLEAGETRRVDFGPLSEQQRERLNRLRQRNR